VMHETVLERRLVEMRRRFVDRTLKWKRNSKSCFESEAETRGGV